MSVSLKITILIFIFLPPCHETLLLKAQGLQLFPFLFHHLLTETFEGPASQACYSGRSGTRCLEIPVGCALGNWVRSSKRGLSERGQVPRSPCHSPPPPSPGKREKKVQLHNRALDGPAPKFLFFLRLCASHRQVADGTHAVRKDLSECLERINLQKSLGLTAQMSQ